MITHGREVELNLNAREKGEEDFWRESEHENPESDSINNIINKMACCGTLLEIIKNYNRLFILKLVQKTRGLRTDLIKSYRNDRLME